MPEVKSWFALNLDPDGTSFWSADFDETGIVAKFDIASGRILVTLKINGGNVRGIAMFGEATAARPEPLAETTGVLEQLMDTTKIVANYVLLAFLVERLTNGLAILLSYSKGWRARFAPEAEFDAVRRGDVERNRRVVLFFLGAAVAVIGALLARLELLASFGVTVGSPVVDRIVSGLLIAAGGDPIREFLQKRQERRDEPRLATPIVVTGTLILQQPATPATTEPPGDSDG